MSSSLQPILDGIMNHDRKVIQNLYRNVFPQLKNYILGNGGEIEDAEDVFQESMLILYNKVQSTDLQIDTSVMQYLFTIGKYVWIKKIKKSRKNEGTFSSEKVLIDRDSLERELQKSEIEDFFYEKFDLLDEGCKELLRLFFESHSMGEIVEKLNLSSKRYARKRKFLCKERLLAIIKQDPRYQEFVNNE